MSTGTHLAWSVSIALDLHPGETLPAFEDLHIQPVIAAALERRGWTPDAPGARDTAPTVARGHNLVAVTPPVPVYAAPAVAGMLSRLEQGKRALFVVPSVQLEEWGTLVYSLAEETSLRVQVARGTSRAMRRLRSESLEVLVASLDTAQALLTRSALRMEAIEALLLAWPELLPTEDSMMPLMQDLPREAQRLVFTADPARVSGLVDRYARKALTVGPTAEAPAAGPVRSVTTSWAGRVQALAEVLELLDPAAAVVWTADRGHHDSISRVIPAHQPEVQLLMGDAPPADTIVAFDLPTPERLRQLLGAGEVVLLVPSGTESYAGRIASPRRPVQTPGPLDAARSEQAQQRALIQQAIESGSRTQSLLALAPLFERYDATLVASALFELWRGLAPVETPARVESAGTAKVYVGTGKKDGVNANDLVAVLTKELRVDRTQIGRIELRDAYSLVELPAQDAERLAGLLNGTTIRRKRVTARVDRGPSRPARGDGGAPGRPARRADRH
jgi:ATP-dependent RNA helicase DeaD